jgi:hypothetical protein
MQEVKYKLFAHIALTKVYGFREVGYSQRMFNTIFLKNFYKKWVFRLKTDVNFSRF